MRLRNMRRARGRSPSTMRCTRTCSAGCSAISGRYRKRSSSQALLLAVAAIVERRTVVGRVFTAICAGEPGAIASGIRVERFKVAAFAISGALAAMSGLMLAARLSGGSPTAADQFLLPAIVAVLVGGTPLTGGVGGVLNTLIGALIVAVIRAIMVYLDIPAQGQQIFFGCVLIAAIALTIDRRKVRTVIAAASAAPTSTYSMGPPAPHSGARACRDGRSGRRRCRLAHVGGPRCGGYQHRLRTMLLLPPQRDPELPAYGAARHHKLIFHLISRLYERTSILVTTKSRLRRMAERLRRSEDDHRIARSPHASLRHRRDRQRKLALQKPRLNSTKIRTSPPQMRNPVQLRRGERCRPCVSPSGSLFGENLGSRFRDN